MIYEGLGLPCCIEFAADDNDVDDDYLPRVPSYFQRLFTLYSEYTKVLSTYHSLTIEISSRARPTVSKYDDDKFQRKHSRRYDPSRLYSHVGEFPAPVFLSS
ncbi:Uncharacterized protein DBV15_10845 [Temnothorax longispinosus]|uniref:Uncharacterized protein n=1 Tax=Temnothorax longispinosus TaxID=300112 RepID=A0A4S2KHR6_9HYME|nr:Uncharacterized protein DBV15_10845 [Temnothorax longispinosus]